MKSGVRPVEAHLPGGRRGGAETPGLRPESGRVQVVGESRQAPAPIVGRGKRPRSARDPRGAGYDADRNARSQGRSRGSQRHRERGQLGNEGRNQEQGARAISHGGSGHGSSGRSLATWGRRDLACGHGHAQNPPTSRIGNRGTRARRAYRRAGIGARRRARAGGAWTHRPKTAPLIGWTRRAGWSANLRRWWRPALSRGQDRWQRRPAATRPLSARSAPQPRREQIVISQVDPRAPSRLPRVAPNQVPP